MNIKQLINELNKYDQSLMVVISGYEGGENEIEKLQVVDIELNRNTEIYYGRHETVCLRKPKGIVIKALKIT